jgi:hypothetical protein
MMNQGVHDDATTTTTTKLPKEGWELRNSAL